MARPSQTPLYPIAPYETLRQKYVGQSLQNVPTPAAVVDVSKVKKNCDHVLEACKRLGVDFRAHVKTHKTTEGTRLQVGEEVKRVNLVVSTLIEAEHLLPYLRESKQNGRSINVLYSMPSPPSQIRRMAVLGKELGAGSMSIMIDHQSQLGPLKEYKALSGHPMLVFLKVDTGGHRAGVEPSSPFIRTLLDEIRKSESEGFCALQGFYSHAGHSYGSAKPADAMNHLVNEIDGVVAVADLATKNEYFGSGRKFVVSVGASPTVTSAQNLTFETPDTSDAAANLRQVISETQNKHVLELHAGVYLFLDCQQLATHARPANADGSTILSFDNIAFTILTEVTSLYPHRPKPEALVAVGVLALGREPCKAYPGWGMVSPWNLKRDSGVNMASEKRNAVEDFEGWIVGRLSQEHGLLNWKGSGGPVKEGEDYDMGLEVGQKLQIWSNHACIAAAGFNWFFVVDSTRAGKEDEIVDIWVRWVGW